MKKAAATTKKKTTTKPRKRAELKVANVGLVDIDSPQAQSWMAEFTARRANRAARDIIAGRRSFSQCVGPMGAIPWREAIVSRLEELGYKVGRDGRPVAIKRAQAASR